MYFLINLKKFETTLKFFIQLSIHNCLKVNFDPKKQKIILKVS